MNDVVAMLNTIHFLCAKRAGVEVDLNELQRLIKTKTAQLRGEIEVGGTTGDKVRDLVLRAGGAVDDPLLPKYRELQAKLAGKRGEFVMIRYSVRIDYVFGSVSNNGELGREEHFRIGLLAGKDLRLGTALGGSPVITLPVDCYKQGHWPRSRAYGISFEKPHPDASPQLDFFEYRRSDDPPSLLQYLTDPYLTPCLVIGDEVFRTELDKIGSSGFFDVACKALGRPVQRLPWAG